ncbi:MAG TPA: alpha/beta fold hydrolase [Kofleriaceae bacterium]|nr:alpha/beta fold hydrolase [Kofleriaceae bacterium]
MSDMSGFVTTARWFGPKERPLCGWWTEPAAGAGTHAVVIAPPIGYEYWSSYRTLRVLAEKLATNGHGVLRLDYDGLGDSAGDRWDEGRVAAWRASLAHAVAEVRALGCSHVTLMGLRVGATFALTEGAALEVDRVVAWVPVTSGKRFMKELRMLGLAVPATEARPQPGNTIVYAGTVFSPETQAAMNVVDTDKLAAAPAKRVLIVARPDRPCEATIARLRALGAETDVQVLDGAETALDIPAEGATVPEHIVDAIAAWIGPGTFGGADAAAKRGRAEAEGRADGEAGGPGVAPRAAAGINPRTRAEISLNGGALVEEVIELGDPPLVAILGTPAGAAPAKDAIVVWLNSGSEPHTGPGRCWVEYTREMNLRGWPTLRLDFSGWGESPDRGHAPGRPYDAHCIDEAIASVAALRARGYERVVLAGLCAGAWIGMRASLLSHVDAVIAINPQLYWFPGEPLDVRIIDTLERRNVIRAREHAKGAKWTMLDRLGMMNYPGRWLTALAKKRAKIHLLFAEGDEGLIYLHNRLERLFTRVTAPGSSITLAQVDDVDHQMYREWRRGDVVATMVEYLDTL